MISAKPLPRFKPKSERLPVRKRMTIAIGILASDGVVIAADREEGDGYLKNDSGKVSQAFKGTVPIGSIAITGSGSGPYLDEVARLITEGFCDDAVGTEATVEAGIRKAHRKYYKESVLPFPHGERPDYDLLVGCYGEQLGRRLWKTAGLALNPVKDYDAVGAGYAVANGLLGRLWDNVPVRYAIKLAAYVIHQVKMSVKDCGLGTDIVIVRRSLLESVSAGIIREWENIFRYYANMERNAFYYCVGLETEQTRLYRTQLGGERLSSEIDELRNLLTRYDPAKPLDDQQVKSKIEELSGKPLES